MKRLNKKTFMVGFAALAIALGTALNVGVSSKKDKLMSDLSLANVEALAIEISSSGKWVVTILAAHSWRCDAGGKVCCPSFATESC
jgi:hypothetical protein